jgi:dTMP kinase
VARNWQGTILDRFIVLEGLDGAGTTTQLELLRAALDRRGDQCCATCEPTGGPIGRVIRDVLRGDLRVTACALALLFAADRTEHLYREPGGIVARLRAGDYVASDRYLFSSLVYQSLECSPDYVAALNQRFPLPRHLFYVDTPPELCQRRLAARRQLELFDDPARQRRLRARYAEVLEQFARLGVAVHTIDGTGDRGAVFARIWRHLEPG